MRVLLGLIVWVGVFVVLGFALGPKRMPGTVSFSYHGESAADGTPLLVPVFAPKLGFGIVAGGLPAKGEFLNCQVSSQVMGKINASQVSLVLLTCGKNAYYIKGILLQPN